MKQIMVVFGVVYVVIVLLFVLGVLVLIVIVVSMGYEVVSEGLGLLQVQVLIEVIGILVVVVVVFQIVEIIMEEEVVCDVNISVLMWVWCFLLWFFVVVIVVLVIEGLVMIFCVVYEEVVDMIYVVVLLIGMGVLLVVWGCFIYCNCFVEELELDVMEEVKEEDKKIDG